MPTCKNPPTSLTILAASRPSSVTGWGQPALHHRASSGGEPFGQEPGEFLPQQPNIKEGLGEIVSTACTPSGLQILHLRALLTLCSARVSLVLSPDDFEGSRTVMPAQAGIQKSQA